MDYNKLAEELHLKHHGKIATALRDTRTLGRDELSAYYTPGVGHISRLVADDPARLRDYTWTNNLVAVVSDGSAVLGLGNIGAAGALPVMEGKALLFKYFADLDSVPIVLDVHDADSIVAVTRAIAPSFGAINLEDIAAPICFEVEDRLKAELDIPVFHDDQHGTAVVVLAALLNACRVTGRDMGGLDVVLCGVGAAGTAIIRLLKQAAPGMRITGIGKQGSLHAGYTPLSAPKRKLLDEGLIENRADLSLADALVGADVFIGVSAPGLVTTEMVRAMAPDPIIFALSNPTPEIFPADALAGGAAVVCTGRSDFPNQVNNALVFPGIFRGALDNHVRKITDAHKLAAARELASQVPNPTSDRVIPSIFEPDLAYRIASVIV
ncbi:MAG: NADP-dependent malic enzyme [Actinomycetes bacterium]|jgi:malate dehydrogenase (oxaloacetate-decarboxylating)|nr:NADP-dependent malic enzyme [Actinomycetes bacterium]